MTVTRLIRIAEQRKRSLLQRDAADTELSRELAFHLEQLTAENVAGGMDREAAAATARRALGNSGVIEEQCREQRRLTWLHDFLQDLGYGLRMLRARPSFTAAVVLSLAAGIGGNTAILSVMDSIAWSPIAFHDPDRLMILRTFQHTTPEQTFSAPLTDYLRWKQTSHSFLSMGASLANELDIDANENGAPGEHQAEHLSGQAFTADLFTTLGADPILGRFFTEDESQLTNPASTIVISYGLWQRRFGADPRILAKGIRLHGRLTRIVGVMPRNFHYVVDTANYWVPLRFDRIRRPDTARYYIVAARLKPGVSIEQAQAETDAVAGGDKGWGVRLLPMRQALFGWTTQSLYTMEAGILLVLLMVSANVSLLLLARASARGPEMALRVALGAGPWRIARQLVTESLLLSLAGGALGFILAWLGLREAPTFQPPPGASHLIAIPMNPRIFLIALLTSIVAATLFGGIPAVNGGKGFRNTFWNKGTARLRSILVIAEVAVALVLLSGAGLLARSALLLTTREFNFNPAGLVTFEYGLLPGEYIRRDGEKPIADDPERKIERVFERLRSLPGVSGVAGISYRPVNSLVLPKSAVRAEGGMPTTVVYSIVTPGYFHVIEGRLVQGRDIDERDTSDHPWVAVINETTARRLWPGTHPLGKRFFVEGLAEDQPREVVGVIRDIPTRSGQVDQDPVVYTSYLQQPSRQQSSRVPAADRTMFGRMTFILRGQGNPLGLVPEARRAVAEVDPAHPISNVATVGQQITGRMREVESYVLVVASLAMLGTLLAVMGVYGMTAFAAAQRTREIAIRIAVGASAWNVFALLGRWGIVLATLGVTAGLAGALATMRLLNSQLWGITATDPIVLAGAALLLAFVTVSSCALPARRAAQVDPATVLRAE